jgi:hypothetical protein
MRSDSAGGLGFVRPWIVVVLVGSFFATAGCGGGSGGSGSTIIQANVLPLTVDPGPGNGVNHLFASVTVCVPGSATSCQTIDHVLVDTGSTGLRIFASALPFTLPPEVDVANSPVANCGKFGSGFTWGPVKLADVKLSGERANSIPIQLINDTSFPPLPQTCSGLGGVINTPQSLGANGLLGVSVLQQDCGSTCATNAVGVYFLCPSGSCHSDLVPLEKQLQNPVGLLPIDNNGFLIVLPSIPAMGVDRVSGSLIFGIGTQFNNALGNAQVVTVDSATGFFRTTYKTNSFVRSIIDSGSNGLFFADSSLTNCTVSTGFYCPQGTQGLSATIPAANGVTVTIPFQVANAELLFSNNPSFFAFNDIAGLNSDSGSFDWGLPFFFGRHVFFALEGSNTPAGPGPYVAF